MPYQANAPTSTSDLRIKLLGSELPILDLMRTLNLLDATGIRTTTLTPNEFMATEEEGEHFCLNFPYRKFTGKAYAIGDEMNLWRLMTIRR